MSFKEVMKDALWQQTMKLKIQVEENNHNWIITLLTFGKKGINSLPVKDANLNTLQY